MTIQTDYEEIERRISLAEREGWKNNLTCLAIERQTFIEENLKRLNETIDFLENTTKKFSVGQEFKVMNGKGKDRIIRITNIYEEMELYNYLNQLKADKQFLEEKR